MRLKSDGYGDVARGVSGIFTNCKAGPRGYILPHGIPLEMGKALRFHDRSVIREAIPLPDNSFRWPLAPFAILTHA